MSTPLGMSLLITAALNLCRGTHAGGSVEGGGGLCVCVLAPNYKSRCRVRSIHMLVHSFAKKYATFYLCFTRTILLAQYASAYCSMHETCPFEIKIRVKKGRAYVNSRI